MTSTYDIYSEITTNLFPPMFLSVVGLRTAENVMFIVCPKQFLRIMLTDISEGSPPQRRTESQGSRLEHIFCSYRSYSNREIGCRLKGVVKGS